MPEISWEQEEDTMVVKSYKESATSTTKKIFCAVNGLKKIPLASLISQDGTKKNVNITYKSSQKNTFEVALGTAYEDVVYRYDTRNFKISVLLSTRLALLGYRDKFDGLFWRVQQ